jgi:hypothetical protein
MAVALTSLLPRTNMPAKSLFDPTEEANIKLMLTALFMHAILSNSAIDMSATDAVELGKQHADRLLEVFK